MSGRTLHWREGKLITNRKTDRRNLRRVVPLDQRPELTLSFHLPGLLGLGLNPHPGIVGVHILPDGRVEITGRDRQWLFEQMIALLRRHAPRGLANKAIDIDIRGEARPPGRMQIIWNGRNPTFIQGNSSRSLRLSD